MNFQLKGVSLSFSGKTLFKDLNLSFVGPGIIAILGPSGSGKSTLIRMLAGLQEPSAGEIIKPSGLRQGFIFQESHLLNWRTTFENVSLPFELKGLSNMEAVARSLKAVGLEAAADLYPRELSGGMKMRASLARAFVTDPHVLFCDEPFAALDEVTREGLQKDLRERILQTQGTCFFVTHNLSEALSVADQIYYFKALNHRTDHPASLRAAEISPKILPETPSEISREPFIVDRKLDPQKQIGSLRTLLRGGI